MSERYPGAFTGLEVDDAIRKARSLYNGAAANVKDYGAVGDGVTDDTAAIVAAIEYARTAQRAVYFPQGVYLVSETLPIYFGVRFLGAGAGGGYAPAVGFNTDPTVDTLKGWGQSVIKLADGANCPVFATNNAYSPIKASTTPNDGRGPVSQYDYCVEFRDLVIYGNAFQQTRYDSDLVSLLDAWNVSFFNCLFVSPRGYCVRAWNCNVVRVNSCILHGNGSFAKGVLFYDTADSFVINCQGGGIHGPNLWLATDHAWLNNIELCHFGDNRNAEIGGRITSVTDNVMTLSQEAWMETGDPFVFWTHSYDIGSALPSGIVAGKTYFAIRISATEFAFNESRPAALAGTRGSISTTGTNAWIVPGPSCAFFLSEASHNHIVNFRADAGYHAGIIGIGGTGNAISNGLISRPGFNGSSLPADLHDRPGLWWRSGSSNIFDDIRVLWCKDSPIKIDAGTNILGAYTLVDCLEDASLVSATSLNVLKKPDGEVTLQKTNITPGNAVLPLALTGLNTATIATLARTGSITASAAIRLSKTVQNKDMLILADGASVATILGLAGDATFAELIIGPDGTALTPVNRIRGGYRSGTNQPGNDVEIVSGGGTGNAAPGRILLKVNQREASGTAINATLSTVLEVHETGVKSHLPVTLPVTDEPDAPDADNATIWADNVAGKVVLKVRFPTGASQTVATEP